MRGAGVWSYAVTNLLHIAAVATLFGSVLLLDLRLLGAWRAIPLAHVEKPALRLAVAGFIVAATSGATLLSTNATEYIGNPFLLLKFVLLALALANVALAQSLPGWRRRHEPHAARRTPALVGALSLLTWSGVLAAGRMIGYW
jgi:uncharacterized membrane protein